MNFKTSRLSALEAATSRDDALFVADPALCVLEADEAFLDLLGVTRQDVQSRRVHLPTGEGTLIELARDVSALSPGRVWRRRVELGRADAPSEDALMTLMPARDAWGGVTQVVGSLRIQDPLPTFPGTSAYAQPTAPDRLDAQLQWEVFQRQQSEQRLGRLLDFNSLLISVNHAISVHTDEAQLLQSICDLAMAHAHLALAYIARPNPEGRFEFLAASGRIEALESVLITADASQPTGLGNVGRAWRDGTAHFNNSYAGEANLAPWREHALAFGLRSNAALALRRGAEVWAVLAVYHEEEDVFDEDLRKLLEQLALDVSRGLDRLDLFAEDKRNRALRESLLNNALVGIVMTRGSRIVDTNAHFAAMLGYRDAGELVDQETQALYADEGSFDRVKALYAQLYETGSAQLRSVSLTRKDGGVMVCDLSANMTYEAGKRLVVWTVVDVTARDALQRQIAFESLHDPLTGLSNRRALDRALPRRLAHAERQGRVIAIGMLDLDDFKQVNDTLGHDAGDELLRLLAERLQSQMRASDLLVRLGGDEFIIVMNDLDTDQLTEQLPGLLDRLHAAVESPFVVGAGQHAEVGMTMGIALFPEDAHESDALIRRADAAMYQCKQHKHDRAIWWRTSSADPTWLDGERDNDPFGPEAARLLGKAVQNFDAVGTQFAEKFYLELSRDEAPAAILRALSAQEMKALLLRQTAHLRFLVDPETTRQEICLRAQHLGMVHALAGVSGAWLSRAQSLYRQILAQHLNHTPLPARERLRTLHIADERLQEDIQCELDAEARTTSAYLDVLATSLPTQGTLWADASEAGLAELSRVPGMQAALVMRLTPGGIFKVEGSAGPQARAIADLLQTAGCEPVLDPDSPYGQALTARAWRSLRIERSASFMHDPRYEAWHTWLAEAAKFSIRSAVSVPILNAAGQVVVVLSLYGAYPNQFESPLMQQFARGLQHRWGQLWHLCAAQAPVIAQDQARDYCQRLLNGGLQMFVQPVVDLQTSRLAKVEALARLVMPDGSVVAPSVFLPLLGSAELDRLFSLSLGQALQHLACWDAQGVELSVAVNLPPSTLLDGRCVDEIARSLRHHGVAPGRLTLEILEGQGIESREQDLAIEQIRRLGVKLAMDDLGSGYSSLRRLSVLPFDAVKIDQSLLLQIRNLPVQTLSLVSTIVQMGRDFELDVIAEGLEDDAVIEAVTILGAGYGQGYGLGRPMPASELLAWQAMHPQVQHDGRIRHFLGALAYHWQYMHGAQHPHPTPVETCPLTAFLAERGFAHSDASKWHAHVHAAEDLAGASAQLLQWLVAQVQRESLGLSRIPGPS